MLSSRALRVPLTKILVALAAACGVIGLVAMVGFSSPAFAAGTGYEGDTGPTGVPGGYQSIITTQTVQTSGGTVTGTIGSDTVTVTVPSEAFPSGTFTSGMDVTITSGNAGAIGNGGVSGDTAVIGIGINITDPTTGDKYTGTFPSPITVTIAGTFNPSDAVVLYNATTSSWQTVSGATVTASEVSFTITSDPDVAVLSPAATQTGAVAGATTVTTGKPFRLEELIAGALVLMGIVALWRLTRRRPSTRG